MFTDSVFKTVFGLTTIGIATTTLIFVDKSWKIIEGLINKGKRAVDPNI